LPLQRRTALSVVADRVFLDERVLRLDIDAAMSRWFDFVPARQMMNLPSGDRFG
jgi:hypothetical protein